MEDFNDINFTDTNDETDKKCPQCGGVMNFDPPTGKLKCPYCEYEETIEAEEDVMKSAEELDFYSAEETANRDWGIKTKTVLCKACGAESVYDAQQAASVCPFCGSNQVMDKDDTDVIAPGGVVPFSIGDKDAAERFGRWISRKWFCPKEAKESAKPKKFNGIYLPYWTFDTDTFSSYHAQFGTEHVHVDHKGNRHTEITWHPTSGTHGEFFNDELVAASDRHDTYMLRRLEPFDTENNKAYKPEYLAGFAAEKYSLGLKDAWKKAVNAIRSKLAGIIEGEIRGRHGTNHVRNLHVNTEFSNITYKHLLLPIWISSFKYNDKTYQFMVNGQTGKVAGKIPISIPKVIITAAAVIAAAVVLYWLFGGFGMRF